MAKTRLYRIIFHNQDSVYEMYANSIGQGDLYGFVEVSGLVFGEHTTLLVDPAEERLKCEFAGVETMHIPMHSVVRIDVVEKTGTAKIIDSPSGGGKITPFPGASMGPRGDHSK